MKTLDIVAIDSGAVGLVVETSGQRACIRWFGRAEVKFAWWEAGERGLKVIDNLAALLTDGLRHPFSTGRENPYQVQQFPPE